MLTMPKLKILIAEDDPVIRKLYETGISDSIFEKQISPDGEEALAVYKEWKPDIVLLDFLMPQMNGFEVLKEIRNANKDKSTTVIMVTSVSDKNEVIACAQLGIQGYIIKPFVARNLAPTIIKYHKSARLS